MSEYSTKSGMDDLVMVSGPSDKTLRDHLKNRFERSLIYTNIGEVLVSCNPFKRLPLYGESHIALYQNASLRGQPPHVYGLAERAYRRLIALREDQAVIISGESGAGKTECAKLILNYVSTASGSSERADAVKKVIHDSNPILEAFGNARTVRNDNSSRFGKYLEVHFDSDGKPCGGEVTSFLLEKLRVVHQNKGERNYHVFYALIAGADAAMREAFSLLPASDFLYLTGGGMTDVPGRDDAAEFTAICAAMETIGISAEEQYTIWQILAGILHLGNLTFEDGSEPPATPTNASALQWASYLFDVEESTLTQAINHRMVQTGGRTASVYFVPQNAQQSREIRDALAKEMYAKVFSHLIERVNGALGRGAGVNSMGILDVFGFEIFEENSFEQFCINYTNERLQQTFIETTIKSEQQMYQDEGLKWKEIEVHDNLAICELIDQLRPPGIIALLNDTCRSLHAVEKGEADEKFIAEVRKNLSSHAHLNVPDSLQKFRIEHYAGKVDYTVSGFCVKNVDALFPSLVGAIQSSNNAFIRSLWDEGDAASKAAPMTSASRIRSSANSLMKKLSSCTGHYIRTIKTNDTRTPMKFENDRVLHQVKYLGLLENVRVLRSGYAYHDEYSTFIARYGELYEGTEPLPADAQAAVEPWIKYVANKYSEIKKDEFQQGKTQLFIHSPETIFSLDEILFKKQNPEEFAEQQAAAKVAAREAAKIQGSSFGKKKKCAIM